MDAYIRFWKLTIFSEEKLSREKGNLKFKSKSNKYLPVNKKKIFLLILLFRRY